jgi:DNA-binding MarR family transcriptional regulator
MPAPSPVSADPTTIANRLRPALMRLNRELRREIHSLGVTGGQASLLIQIGREPGVGVNELAARERMSAPGMSKAIGRLEAQGFVTRSQSPDDKRRFGLRLTDEGARVVESVKRRRTAWLSARLRGLEPDDLDRIDAAIEPLLKLLEVDA